MTDLDYRENFLSEDRKWNPGDDACLTSQEMRGLFLVPQSWKKWMWEMTSISHDTAFIFLWVGTKVFANAPRKAILEEKRWMLFLGFF